MTDVFLTWEETVDPAACNAGRDKYMAFSRDPERTPFQWDSSTSAGFSSNPKTWLPVSPLYQQVNVKQQKAAQRSHLKVYQQLLRLRQTETLKGGTVETRAHGQNVLSITRTLQGRDIFITIANIGHQRETIDLREIFSGRLIYSIVSVDSTRKEGDVVQGFNLDLDPHEAFVLKGSSEESFYKYTIEKEPEVIIVN